MINELAVFKELIARSLKGKSAYLSNISSTLDKPTGRKEVRNSDHKRQKSTPFSPSVPWSHVLEAPKTITSRVEALQLRLHIPTCPCSSKATAFFSNIIFEASLFTSYLHPFQQPPISLLLSSFTPFFSFK